MVPTELSHYKICAGGENYQVLTVGEEWVESVSTNISKCG